MSALAALAQYSSDSEDSDDIADVSQEPCAKKARLPTPKLLVRGAAVAEHHQDEPAAHGGRTRAFPHERGNWPTFVYVPCGESEWIEELAAEARACSALQLEPCGDLHVSLSRTIGLRYHWINTFTATLQASLRDVECIEVELSSVKVYCNDEQTRSFVALAVDSSASRALSNITEKVDAALDEFKLPKYYKEPSFHVSVLWCNGNKLSELQSASPQLQEALARRTDTLTVTIDRVVCKCGNRLFQFPLKC